MSRRRVLKQMLAWGVGAAVVDKSFALKPLPSPQPVEVSGKVEVLEFFSYGCPHCHHLDPDLTVWLKKQPADVNFIRVPVSFGRPQWAMLGRLYYTLDAMGELGRLHTKVFTDVQEKGVRLDQMEVQLDWAVANGLDKQKFSETAKSFNVETRMQRAERMTANYKVMGVPQIVVGGKYIADGGTFSDMLKDADQLIVRVRKELGR